MFRKLKGARSRCEYAYWVLPICQLYVSNFYCFPSYVTRSRARGCKSRHLQVVLVTYCGVWCEIITIQFEEKLCSDNFEEVQHISGLGLSTKHNREIIFCGLHVTRSKK